MKTLQNISDYFTILLSQDMPSGKTFCLQWTFRGTLPGHYGNVMLRFTPEISSALASCGKDFLVGIFARREGSPGKAVTKYFDLHAVGCDGSSTSLDITLRMEHVMLIDNITRILKHREVDENNRKDLAWIANCLQPELGIQTAAYLSNLDRHIAAHHTLNSGGTSLQKGANQLPAILDFTEQNAQAWLAQCIQKRCLPGGWHMEGVMPFQPPYLRLVFRHDDYRTPVTVILGPCKENMQPLFELGPLAASVFGDFSYAHPGLQTGISFLMTLLPQIFSRIPPPAKSLRFFTHPQVRHFPFFQTRQLPGPRKTLQAKQIQSPKYIRNKGPGEANGGQILNIAIQTACDLKCCFCSIDDIVPEAVFLDDDFISHILADVKLGKDRGIDCVRINGKDPLNYHEILTVLISLKECGYSQVWLYSTFLKTSKRDFVKALSDCFDFTTQHVFFSVPLYGACAETHDAVTGLTGSFDTLMHGLQNIMSIAPKIMIKFECVIVDRNHHQLMEIQQLAQKFKSFCSFHLPFPSTDSVRDNYHSCAMRISDLLPSLYRSDPPIALYDIYPCMIWRHDHKHGTDYFTRTIFSRQPRLPGVAYRRDGGYVQGVHNRDSSLELHERIQTIACPWQGDCSLVKLCPVDIYRQYLERFGGDEFEPVE